MEKKAPFRLALYSLTNYLFFFKKKRTLASLFVLYSIYLFSFIYFTINKKQKWPLTLPCSILILFYLFYFYLLYNKIKNLATCTALD